MANDINSFFIMAGGCNSCYYFNEYKKAIDAKDNLALGKCAIINYLDGIVDSNFAEVLHKGTGLFRARKIDVHNDLSGKGIVFDGNHFVGFDKDNSKEAPIWVSQSQRCSPKGMSIFYAAKDEYTACAEVSATTGDYISVAKFRLKNDLRVINFKDDKNILDIAKKIGNINMAEVSQTITRIMFQFAVPISEQEDYIYSQYIADYIRKAGFDGMIYASSKTGDSNIAIFNCSQRNIEYLSSDIKYVHYSKYSFYDLNSRKKIDSQKSVDAGCTKDLSPKEISKIINDLKTKLKNIKNSL